MGRAPQAAMLLSLAALCSSAPAQTSSLAKRAEYQDEAGSGLSGETAAHPGNPLLEANSLIAIAVTPPKEFRKQAIITIIVRQQKSWEVEADLESRKKLELESTLDAFVKFTGGGIGASVFRRGKPNIDYEFESRLKNRGDTSREDTFVTRVSGKIIDIKPNGNLVIEARGHITHDEETSDVTVTGIVRASDVTPDNTVLSTQVADLRITVKNTGAVRDATTRGWVTRVLDWLKPI